MYWVQTKVTLIAIALNMVLLLWLFLFIREEKKISNSDNSPVN